MTLAEREPFVEKKLRLEYDRQEQEHAAWLQSLEQQRAEQLEQEKRIKAEHPRYGEWGSLEKAELEELVWSMPTEQVAKLFGVSRSAVGKRCKVWNISKPPRGFWAQVHAGRREHPRGKPQ